VFEGKTIGPFTSMKVLAHLERVQQFYGPSGVLIPSQYMPPPPTVDVELTNLCNLKCAWCYPADWRSEHPRHMPWDHVEALSKLLREWQAGVQITGGGEPLLHPRLDDFLGQLRRDGLVWSVITNGTSWAELHGAAWVGVSVDASSHATWEKVKGVTTGAFSAVRNNIAAWAKSGVPVWFKFLVGRNNCDELLPAALLAEQLGCVGFHARCAYGAEAPGRFDASLRMQTEAVLARSRPGFRTHVMQHKILPAGVTPPLPQNCRATPLLLTVCADGQAYVCQDHRGEEPFRLGPVGEVRTLWGSSKHIEILQRIDPRQCRKCTFCGYNAVLEQVYAGELGLEFL
jgi:MoaA/NifB/PqqE/SkfB family radical SAM enzyme